MIKRPLNSRFSDKAKADIKITTIRDKAWPIGKPVMLYNWSDKAYRSKQIDVCAVEVLTTRPIIIRNTTEGMRYSVHAVAGRLLWSTEGFESGEDMDAWFSRIVAPGQSIEKQLMHFRRIS